MKMDSELTNEEKEKLDKDLEKIAEIMGERKSDNGFLHTMQDFQVLHHCTDDPCKNWTDEMRFNRTLQAYEELERDVLDGSYLKEIRIQMVKNAVKNTPSLTEEERYNVLDSLDKTE